jgi:hypothetical protein
MGTGDVLRARSAAMQAVVLDPSNWHHQSRLAVACWGEERRAATHRALLLFPDFAPACFLSSMVFVARQAFDAAEEFAPSERRDQVRVERSVAVAQGRDHEGARLVRARSARGGARASTIANIV